MTLKGSRFICIPSNSWLTVTLVINALALAYGMHTTKGKKNLSAIKKSKGEKNEAKNKMRLLAVWTGANGPVPMDNAWDL